MRSCRQTACPVLVDVGIAAKPEGAAGPYAEAFQNPLAAERTIGLGRTGRECLRRAISRVRPIHVVRVGKANTLLITPGDWSTLSNGTVDGRATGYHRYVGEQRFAFALLNVTDGDGDVVSYDLETKDGDFGPDYYSDSSGNGLHACHAGDTPVGVARFGGGVLLSGSNSLVAVCGVNPSAKLNQVYQAFTVSFWIRPDKDYNGTGTGWAWSFGRKDLWRVGYDRAVGGVEVAVNDSGSGQWRSASAPYSLHAGV